MADKQTDSSSPQPLGLTVYDLPEPGAVADADARQTTGGRLRMLMVLLVCAAPVIASYLTFYVLRPQSLRSFGELVLPVAAMPDIQATNLKGEPISLRSLTQQWLLVSVSSGACDSACQQNLYLQRQTRAALGRERDRTDWVWLITDDAPVDAALLAGLQDAVVLRVSAADLAQWLSPQDGQRLQDHLYLVDPKGDWMMRFPAHLQIDQAPRMRKDWERLLRAAASWDKAGR
jgi:hypothetical protein